MAEKETKEKPIVLKEVTQVVGHDIELSDGTVLTQVEYLVWLGNQIIDIRKAIG